MKSMLKLTLRNIRSSFMRYLAILLIVMLSVGFFSGLKITRDAMAKTGGDYLTEQHFYDYRLISTLGFTEDDVQAFSGASDVIVSFSKGSAACSTGSGIGGRRSNACNAGRGGATGRRLMSSGRSRLP